MGNYAELYFHFVWATKGRAPFITEDIEAAVYDCIRNECVKLKVTVYAINGMPDHVHLACGLPSALSMAECMKRIKGVTSRAINRTLCEQNAWEACLYWQENYGVLTFAHHDLPRIVSYIDRQKEHHAEGSLRSRLERCDDGYVSAAVPKGLTSE